MSRLDDLIQKYCPNGVVYKYISDICEITRGIVLSKDYINQHKGEYPVYSSQTENNGCLGKIDSFNFDGEYITWTTDGANAGTVFFRNGKFSITNVCGLLAVIDDKINVKFLFYVLSIETKKYVNRGMGNAKLMSNVMSKIKVPVPPLPVQEEIVRILDSFTKFNEELIKELTKELINRKKQHEYYRDELLNFDKINKYCPNGIKYKKLEEFATINRGGSLQKKDFVDEGIPCIHYGQIYTKYGLFADKTFTYISEKIASKQKFAEKNDIVMAVTSENLKDVCSCLAWLGNEKIAISGHTAIIHHNQNAKFMSYYFHSIHFQKQKNKLAHGTKVIEVTPSKLKNIIIPIPSIVEQECIVDILDKFEVMYNNLYSEISAEIEARKKQYEYYKDKLLTFKELKQ